MFGNFKRDVLLRALNKYIKGIHPQLQVMQIGERCVVNGDTNKTEYVVCLEGIKKKNDLMAFFMLPIDPASPTIIDEIQAQFYKDDVFLFRDLADAVQVVSNLWKTHLKSKTGMTLRLTTTGCMAEPFIPAGYRKAWHSRGQVTMCVSVANPAGIVDDHFWLMITVPDQNREFKLQSWRGGWAPPSSVPPSGSKHVQDSCLHGKAAEHGRLFAQFIESAEESKTNRLVHCGELARVLKTYDETAMAQYFLMNPSIYRSLRKRF